MKTLLIAKREFFEYVRKKSFIITTLLMPVIMLAFYSIPILSMFFVPNEQTRGAVIDPTGRIADDFIASVDDTLKDGSRRYVLQRVSADIDRDELVAEIQNDQRDVVIEIPADILETGEALFMSENIANEQVSDDLRSHLNSVVMAERFEAEGLSASRVDALTRPVRFNERKITKSGVLKEEEAAGDYVIAIAFMFLLYMMLLMWGMAVQRSIIEEKSSRVMEVLLSAVEPKDLFLGKILGTGSAAFVQLGIWAVIMIVLGLSSAMVTARFADFIQISVSDIMYLVLFFVLGFLLYSALFSMIGAVCSSERDAQHLQGIAMYPIILPMMLIALIIQNPDSTFSVVLSMIPFFAPMLMLVRVSISQPPMWQVIVAVVLLIVSIYGVAAFSAKIFRVGILMYGKRPSLKEVFRWARYA